MQTCSANDFEMGRILGTGSFGRVALAKHKPTNTVVAIKSLLKSHIIKNQQVSHVQSEREVLAAIDHPFVVRMHANFQDEHCCRFVMEYIAGGEFFSHLRSRGQLPEDAARFYAAQVLLVFEYLHSKDIIYRDLKPENMLLDSEGYLKLADFGFAKVLPGGKRTYTLCGTCDYLAPEVILSKGHGRAVDWWELGILMYEMLAGYPPFCDTDAMGTYQRILKGVVTFPFHVSPAAKDLIRKLLQADLSKRYGCLAGGAQDIKGHQWFRSVNFSALLSRKIPAPIRPVVKSVDDTSNFEDYGDLPPLVPTPTSSNGSGGGGGSSGAGGGGSVRTTLSDKDQAQFSGF